MNLKEFISQTISDIVLGIEDSSVKLQDKGKRVRLFSSGKADVRHVEFDVAVTASSGGTDDAGVGGEIKVWGLAQVGSKVTSKQETFDSTVSRVKFGVRIDG
jgi:hypothetical protein